MEKIKDIRIINLDKFSDERGYLVKVIKKEYVQNELGEVYITSTNPGNVKANHYHRKTTEWFCVLKGKCLLLLKEAEANNRMELVLDAEKPQLVRIPPFVEHAIKNIGNENMILFTYADRPYDPSDTIKTKLKFE